MAYAFWGLSLASVLPVNIHSSQGVMEMKQSFTLWSETCCCRLPQLLEGNMPGYSLAATRYDEDARKIGCARRVVGEHCDYSWLSLNQLAAGCVRLQHCLYNK